MNQYEKKNKIIIDEFQKKNNGILWNEIMINEFIFLMIRVCDLKSEILIVSEIDIIIVFKKLKKNNKYEDFIFAEFIDNSNDKNDNENNDEKQSNRKFSIEYKIITNIYKTKYTEIFQ